MNDGTTKEPTRNERVARWSRMLAEASKQGDSKIEATARIELLKEFEAAGNACVLIQQSAEVIAETIARFDAAGCTDPTCERLHCAECGRHVEEPIEADEQVFCCEACFEAGTEQSNGSQ